MDLDGIAGPEVRQVKTHLLLINLVYDIHGLLYG
jgi:hypothetical protein